jgi:hypothetical protein
MGKCCAYSICLDGPFGGCTGSWLGTGIVSFSDFTDLTEALIENDKKNYNSSQNVLSLTVNTM